MGGSLGVTSNRRTKSDPGSTGEAPKRKIKAPDWEVHAQGPPPRHSTNLSSRRRAVRAMRSD